MVVRLRSGNVPVGGNPRTCTGTARRSASVGERLRLERARHPCDVGNAPRRLPGKDRMMAGFFRQTAQRARASGSQLHSSAALPYAAAREAQGEGPWLDDALSASANTTRVAGPVVPGTSIAPPAPPRARDDRETQPLPRKSRRSTSAPKNKVSKPAPRSSARVSRTPRSIVEHVVSLAPLP